jgi:hypothetical protein
MTADNKNPMVDENEIDFDNLGSAVKPIIPKKPYVEVHLESYGFETRTAKETKNDYNTIFFKFIEKGTGNQFELLLQEPKHLEDCVDKKNKDLVIASLQRTKHVFSAFTKETLTTDKIGAKWNSATDWKTVYEAFAKFMPENYQEIEVRLKLVRNGKYAAVPLYPDFISTKMKPCEFVWNPQYDKIEIEEVKPQIEGGATATNNSGW